MADKLNMEQQMELITSNLQEVLNKEIMEEVMKKGEPLSIYWGTATTGRPHCGYVGPPFSPIPFTQLNPNLSITSAAQLVVSEPRLTLLTVRPSPQNRPVPASGLPHENPSGRHPRLPRQSEGSN